MGHYWREMDPEGAERHDRHISRHLSLKEKIADWPVSLFKVKDLHVLTRLMSWKGTDRVTDEELDQLEASVQEIERKSKKKK